MNNIINYKLISFLLSWIFPTKETRRAFRTLCNTIEDEKETPKIFKRYKKIIKKIAKKKQIRVIFLISENSKWKAQSLFDLMDKSEKFEPIIALTVLKGVHKGEDITRNNIDEDYNYFRNKGMQVVLAYEDNKFLDLKNFNPDIVFYQQPWDISKLQSPKEVSKYALTYYIPYYVNNYELQPIEYEQELHRFVYKYFVLNKWWEDEYKRKSNLNNVVGLGNPILDNFRQNNNHDKDKNYVIYAPHYSFFHELNKNPVNYGTFLENGELILGFAQEHKEYNWVFKPHPQLKFALYKVWGKDKTDKYYMDWENIGLACYDSSYIELFKKSKLLITDCDSFLLEYFCTTNPIIHLISPKCSINPSEFSKNIFDSFYKVKTNEELFASLDEILIKNNDFKKESRNMALKKSNLLNSYAAQNIIDEILKDVDIKNIEV
jgi:hypothetical protein